MKILRGGWIALAAWGLAWSASHARAQNLDLNGYWQSDAEGTVRIQHDVNTGYVLIEGSPCPNGAQRPHTLAGVLEGSTLTGTMWRCTNQELIDECGHPRIYLVNFAANVSLDTDPFSVFGGGEIDMASTRINANWLMEYYIVQDCKQKRTEARSDLIFIGRSAPGGPTPRTSPGTAPPPLNDVCAWAKNDACQYASCLWHRYGWGSPPQTCR